MTLADVAEVRVRSARAQVAGDEGVGLAIRKALEAAAGQHDLAVVLDRRGQHEHAPAGVEEELVHAVAAEGVVQIPIDRETRQHRRALEVVVAAQHDDQTAVEAFEHRHETVDPAEVVRDRAPSGRAEGGIEVPLRRERDHPSVGAPVADADRPVAQREHAPHVPLSEIRLPAVGEGDVEVAVVRGEVRNGQAEGSEQQWRERSRKAARRALL